MSAPLRWTLAVAVAPGLVAGAWLLLEGRPLVRPGMEMSSAGRGAPPVPLAVLAGRRTSGTEPERIGRGLGAYLVRSGRPTSPLVPVKVEGQLSRPSPGRLPGESLVEQPAPPPAPGFAAKVRQASGLAARDAIPARFAPSPRRIPPARRAGSDPSRLLAPPAAPPKLRPAAGTTLPPAPEKPLPEEGTLVKPPESGNRLPAPVVPLPM